MEQGKCYSIENRLLGSQYIGEIIVLNTESGKSSFTAKREAGVILRHVGVVKE